MQVPFYILFLVAAILFGEPLAQTASAQTPITMGQFRFGKHKAQDFERLVIQFKGKRPDPKVQIIAHPSKKEATIALENVHLIGAIPESSINDSYVDRSSYLGPISINTDDPEQATTLRVFLKENTLRFDAFWIQNPPRLVVDAFPPTSPRSTKGRFILKKAKKTVTKSREPASTTFGTGNVICFPIAAQLSPTVAFKEDPASTPPNFVQNSQNGPIACYPVDAKVKATINFAPASRIPQSSVAAAQQRGYTAPKLLPPPPPVKNQGPPNLPKPPGLSPGVAPGAAPGALGAPPRLPNSSGSGGLENTGGKGSRVNAGGFSPVTPLGSKLGAGGPIAPAVDPTKLLPFTK